VAGQGRDAPVRAWLRFFRSELRLIFGRRRNQALLAVVTLFPIIIGIGLRLADQGGNSGGPSVAFIGQLAGNGVFLSFIALTLLLILVMPLAVAVVAGDSIAGEAGYGTLRYLLAVPAGRVRILAVKYAAIVVFALAVTFAVTAVALATGAALFPIGPVTLLSGTTVPLADALLRLLFVTLYVAAAMASLGAMGMAISTVTEHAVGAIAALAIVVVTSEVADNVPQFAVIHPYLPTHWWNSFDSLLRVPIDTGTLLRGLLSFGVYLRPAASLPAGRDNTAVSALRAIGCDAAPRSLLGPRQALGGFAACPFWARPGEPYRPGFGQGRPSIRRCLVRSAGC
jgi:ABC-2 type transport system permease protein